MHVCVAAVELVRKTPLYLAAEVLTVLNILMAIFSFLFYPLKKKTAKRCRGQATRCVERQTSYPQRKKRKKKMGNIIGRGEDLGETTRVFFTQDRKIGRG